MQLPPLDMWNYALLSVEFLMNLAFFPFSIALAYVCIVQKNFHVNFRMLLQLANIGNCLQNAHRITVMVDRIWHIAEEHDDFLDKILPLLDFSSCLFLTSWTSLVVERAVASLWPRNYDQKCRSLTFTLLFAMPTLFFASFIAYNRIFPNFAPFLTSNLLILIIYIVLTLIAAIAIPIILHYNKVNFNQRHLENMDVATKYQLSENIRATRYILPAAFVGLGSKIIHTCFLLYSAIFTSYPIGLDTTHFSHAYDLLLSGTRLLITAWLILTNEKIGLRRYRRTYSVGNDERHTEGEYYFNNLYNLWNK